MILIILSFIFLFCLIFILFKYNQQVIKNISNKTKYDLMAHKNMNCNVIKKIHRPDLGLGIYINVVYDSCYDSLPHTIDENTIIIPQSLYIKGGIYLKKVLDHELVHIMQRRDLITWKQFYSFFKWKLYDNLNFINFYNVPLYLIEKIRYNPDISYSPYAIWNNRYLFVSCYIDIINPKIKESKTIIYDLYEKKEIEGLIPEYYEWMKRNQNEHPHEIFAEIFAELENSNKIDNIDNNTLNKLKTFYFLQKRKLFEN